MTQLYPTADQPSVFPSLCHFSLTNADAIFSVLFTIQTVHWLLPLMMFPEQSAWTPSPKPVAER